MIKVPKTTLNEEWRYNHLWFCDNCGKGGFSISTDLQCPECQHHQCEFCHVILEDVLEGKCTEGPRKRGVLRCSYPHSPPTPPKMSLTLLPKVPTEQIALTVLQEENVDKLASLLYTSPLAHIRSQGKDTTTISEPRCIALSDISPASSPPGLSPSPTESSLYSSDSSNSEVASPATTDLYSDTTSFTEEENEYEESIESESEFPTAHLDSRLFEVLGRDLKLAARLVPQIHDLMQSSSPEDIAIKVVASGAPGEGAQQTPSSSSGSVPTPSSSGSRVDLQRRKHKRKSEEEEEKKRNGGSKRPRKRFGHNSPRPSGFACPFHKKEPWKYVAATDIKYRTCAGPGPLEVRRVKEHLKSHHKPPQCERCYRIFEDFTQRTEHKSGEICVQNGIELKEGIDDGQWQRIEALLKKSKKEPTREIKDQVEKWFEIWEVVFPNTPRPSDPWSDSNQTKLATVTLEVADVVDMLDRVIARDIDRGLLHRDDHVHGRYRLALREVWERAIAISSQPLASSPLPPLESHSESRRLQDFRLKNGTSVDHLLPAHLSSYGADQSPSGASTTNNVQDAASQSWASPLAHIENSTPISTQNSLVTQWGTPQESLTPAISTTQNTTLETRDVSIMNSHFPLEMPSYEIDATLALPLQSEWDEEWEQTQNFELGALISQRNRMQLGTSQPESTEPVPRESLLVEEEAPGWQDSSDAFANNQSLTAILESEIELPTAGAPIKDHKDRNKGLQGPLYED